MKADGNTVDIVVVGGGLVGLAVAASAARRGYSVAHLAPPAPTDRRSSALMLPSISILKEAGLVDDVSAIGTPLTGIRIIDATHRLVRAPETFFDSAEAGHEAFGWNFPNEALLEAFVRVAGPQSGYVRIDAKFTGMRRDGDGHVVEASDGSKLQCKLVIGCDGRSSPVRKAAGIGVREHKFRQSALVCDLELGRPLEGVSIEFHYENGPFTLVPAGARKANLVWIDKADVLLTAQQRNEAGFRDILEAKAQHLFGHIQPVGRSFIFPLSRLSAEVAGKDGIALAGEAAHAFPPIGAQGLNLGLRDVRGLLESLDAHAGKQEGWADAVSRDYASRREGDLRRTATVVDTLFRSLLSDMLPAQALRAGGLWALKAMPYLRRQAFAAGMGER